jgi:hypothetical protein
MAARRDPREAARKKIASLMALALDSDSGEEGATAFGTARVLAHKHGLAFADVIVTVSAPGPGAPTASNPPAPAGGIDLGQVVARAEAVMSDPEVRAAAANAVSTVKSFASLWRKTRASG